jgi:hypothetical protein
MPTATFNYREIEPRIKQALYENIGPHIAVGSEEMDDGRVFLKVVATELNGLSAKKKQDVVWDALHTLGPDAQAVSLVLAFGTDEI